MRPIGYIDDVTRFAITGWAADQDNLEQSVDLVILVDEVESGKIKAESFRRGLDSFATGATGRYQFRFYFDPPLPPFHDVSLSVRVAGSDFNLEPGIVIVKAVSRHPVARSFRPDNAILVSTMGRSGSTLLMHILARHPFIVVADKKPFEIEMITYYSYLFRMMIAQGDHEKSLRPDRITDVQNRFRIGLNPYFEATFRNNFNDPTRFSRFLDHDLPLRVGSAFRDIILDFYAAVAEDLGKPAPLYFAEKALPEGEIRDGSRYFFPKTKEIVLIRDLRDALCSFQRYGGLSLEDSIEYIRSSSIPIRNAKLDNYPNTHFVRYEDLVTKPANTIADIFSFIGLSAPLLTSTSAQNELFDAHATSENPNASIGRWKRDLTATELALCDCFKPFQELFGYEG